MFFTDDELNQVKDDLLTKEAARKLEAFNLEKKKQEIKVLLSRAYKQYLLIAKEYPKVAAVKGVQPVRILISKKLNMVLSFSKKYSEPVFRLPSFGSLLVVNNQGKIYRCELSTKGDYGDNERPNNLIPLTDQDMEKTVEQIFTSSLWAKGSEEIQLLYSTSPIDGFQESELNFRVLYWALSDGCFDEKETLLKDGISEGTWLKKLEPRDLNEMNELIKDFFINGKSRYKVR